MIRTLINLSNPKWLLACVMAIWVNQAIAQHSDNSQIVNLTDEINGEPIGTSIYYLKDLDYALSLDSVLQPKYRERFIKCDMIRPNFGNVEMAIWNRITVANHTDETWFIDFGVYTVDSLVLFVPDQQGNYERVKQGRSVPYREKKYNSQGFLFDLPIEKGDTVDVYFKVCSYIMQYPVSIHSKQSLIRSAHSRDIISGMYVGFVVLIILYNFMIWWFSKDRNYLIYIFYVFFNAVLIFELNGMAAQLIWIGPFTSLWAYGPILTAFASLAGLYFTVNFLNTKENARILDKLFRYVFPLLLIAVMVLNIVGDNLAASIMNQSIGFFGLILMFTAGFIAFKRGYRAARFYMLATSFYFIGVIIFILKTFAIIPYSFLADKSMEIGSALEMVLFSVALADRINIYKAQRESALRANEKLVKEQNVILERTVSARTADLITEKEKSEKLLLNILPKEIADELKESGHAKARSFDQVVILFTDFVGFTEMASKLSAAELVGEINYFFKAFDAIIKKYKIEKIKTVGDAYMAAAGLSGGVLEEYASSCILASIDMQLVIQARKQQKVAIGEQPFEMRVGLHVGNVVAGIVGDTKFQYDIWGDSVNIASRMETLGEIGRINISSSLYEILKSDGKFAFEDRGKIPVKGKGEMKMYWVDLK